MEIEARLESSQLLGKKIWTVSITKEEQLTVHWQAHKTFGI